MELLTQKRAYEVLNLDVETGILTWRVSLGPRAQAGEQAGSLYKRNGYRFVQVDGERYREHVLIWFMLYGEWRPREIDHHDLNRANNRPSNLRIADESQQRSNAKLRADNALGERGVSFHSASGLYVAEVRRGDHRFVKYFHAPQEAAAAAKAERLRVFGEFAPALDQQGI